jgi:hypothetical protein
MKNGLISAFVILAIATPSILQAQCKDCPQKTEDNALSSDIELSKKWSGFLLKMHDSSLDNPDDSTSQRAEVLNSEFLITIQPGAWKDKLFLLLIDLLKNDSYPEVRWYAAGYLTMNGFPHKEVYNALNSALNDPSIAVKVQVAAGIQWCLMNSGLALDPRSEKILRDAAIGKNRSNWNLKGFYTNDDFKKDPVGVVEYWRDRVQERAIIGLDYGWGYNGKCYFYLDSTAKNDANENIRKTAKHGLELLNK